MRGVVLFRPATATHGHRPRLVCVDVVVVLLQARLFPCPRLVYMSESTLSRGRSSTLDKGQRDLRQRRPIDNTTTVRNRRTALMVRKALMAQTKKSRSPAANAAAQPANTRALSADQPPFLDQHLQSVPRRSCNTIEKRFSG